ncbi:ribonuclease HII [[Mycoplasma] gypis]|uniref:Ribonuclease n=1 Tax=[Mycoplasma] gypis TaxID=92404 RepID=A0ABZ2RNV4_9BACT|nr:ribonuclease HII [[Mycoplasma] gypis]MBN0919284.1 ribonuclease HII [[Mycoplasma] gypis]
MLDFEKNYWNNFPIIAGLDEVGRGCLAGPLVVACVILPTNYQNELINDSKKINPRLRKILSDQIKKDALEYFICVRNVEDINASNPKKESVIGMQMCLKNLKNTPDLVITDYEKIQTNIQQINIIKGDQKSINVAAASIIAKVFRDELMDEYDLKYPNYDFKNNKGYGTKKHLEALDKFGALTIHRSKYKPVILALEKFQKKSL